MHVFCAELWSVHETARVHFLLGRAAAWPVGAGAQQPAMPALGFLGTASLGPCAHYVDEFLRGLKEVGYFEGQNVTVEYRWAKTETLSCLHCG